MSEGREPVERPPSAPVVGLPEDRLPFAPEAERAVLGAILDDFTLLVQVRNEHVEPEDFHHRPHQLIFGAMVDLYEDGLAAAYEAVVDRLRARDQLTEVGGETAMSALLRFASSALLVGQYARTIKDRAVSRQLMRTAFEIAQAGMGGEHEDSESYIGFAEGRLLQVLQQTARGGVLSMKDVLNETISHIETMSAQGEGITGTATGIRDLDAKTLGMHGGELIILAARPAMGKSSLAMNIAAHVAMAEEKAVLLFSLEMSAEQLGMRLLAQEGRVDLRKLRSGQLGVREWDDVHAALKRLNKARMSLDPTPSLTVSDIAARARRLAATKDCDLVVLDYLQLVQGRPGIQSREQQVADVSRSLKQLAMELNIPVIALSQLNRGVEGRPKDKRPILSDLRESGAIEQDADVIMFLYRDEVYTKDECENPGIAEVIVAKQRNGPTGTVEMRFIGEFTRFENLDPGYLERDLHATVGGLGPAPAPIAEAAPPADDDFGAADPFGAGDAF